MKTRLLAGAAIFATGLFTTHLSAADAPDTDKGSDYLLKADDVTYDTNKQVVVGIAVVAANSVLTEPPLVLL